MIDDIGLGQALAAFFSFTFAAAFLFAAGVVIAFVGAWKRGMVAIGGGVLCALFAFIYGLSVHEISREGTETIPLFAAIIVVGVVIVASNVPHKNWWSVAGGSFCVVIGATIAALVVGL